MSLPNEYSDLVKSEKPRKKRKAQPESWVKGKIKTAVAEEAPKMWWYMPVQGPEGEHGVPDYVGCVPVTVTQDMVGTELGVFLAIEAKADDGVLSIAQKRCIKLIKDARGIAWVVRGGEGVKGLRDKLKALLHASR